MAAASARRHVVAPRLPVPHVPRPRLTGRLEAANPGLVTVVGAPGAGKTTLLAEWALARRGPTAWLTCTSADADAAGFAAALGAAMRRAAPSAREADGLVIVVDDLHLAGAAATVIGDLLDALPPSAKVVVGARQDPPLPLARLRLHGQLTEVRDEDLCFGFGEADALAEARGVVLAADAIERLMWVTEGWPAGVQLAAAWLANDADVDRLVDGFGATDRGVADFVDSEILAGLPAELTTLLFDTCVLEQFDAELCDAVRGRHDSAELLRRLRERHILLVAIADRPGWFRYHRTFVAYLRRRLLTDSAPRLREAHLAASRAWLARGDPLAAIEHAHAGGDLDGAAALMRAVAVAEHDAPRRSTPLEVARTWLRQHGTAVTPATATLVLECVIIVIALGALDDAEVWLRQLDRHVGEMTPVDRALSALSWGFLALHRGDPGRALTLIGDAQRTAGASGAEQYWLAQAPLLACNAYVLGGDTAGLRRTVDSARAARLPSPFVDAVRFPGYLAYAAAVDGELDEAQRHATRVLDEARSMGLDDGDVALVLPRLALARIARDRDDLGRATQLLDVATVHALASGRPTFPLWCKLERVRTLVALRALGEARRVLERARRLMPAATAEVTDQLDAVEALIGIAAGDRRQPAIARREHADWTMLRARLALTAGDAVAARRLLDDIVASTRRQRIEHLCLLARAVAERDRPRASACVHDAVVLAAPMGMVRPLLDEGPALVAMVAAMPADATLQPFVERVLDLAHLRATNGLVEHGAGTHDPSRLTDRELDVVRYLATRLTYAEIAAEMGISVNTLKTHLKAIYRKLDVATRSQAVEAILHG